MFDINRVSEVKLSFVSDVPMSERPRVTSSREIVALLRPFFADSIEHHESMGMLLTNRDGKVLGFKMLSTGGVAGTVCDPKMVFQTAILSNCTSFVLVHNHPSGNLTPSQADKQLTKKIQEAAKLLDYNVLDHIILTQEKYFSFADEYMM